MGMNFIDVMKMRLVDANVVINKLENEAKKTSGLGCRRRLEVVRLLRQQPTVDLYDLVSHGYWTFYSSHGEDEYEYKCSRCNNYVNQRYPFCPYCGAEMNLKGDTI